VEEGRLCPEPGVQFRFPPLVRRATALWQSTRCTTKFGGLNKLGGRPPRTTWKNQTTSCEKAQPGNKGARARGAPSGLQPRCRPNVGLNIKATASAARVRLAYRIVMRFGPSLAGEGA